MSGMYKEPFIPGEVQYYSDDESIVFLYAMYAHPVTSVTSFLQLYKVTYMESNIIKSTGVFYTNLIGLYPTLYGDIICV